MTDFSLAAIYCFSSSYFSCRDSWESESKLIGTLLLGYREPYLLDRIYFAYGCFGDASVPKIPGNSSREKSYFLRPQLYREYSSDSIYNNILIVDVAL